MKTSSLTPGSAPNLDADRAIQLMRELEPVFIRAADRACELQADAKSSHKNDGGYIEIEIVTTADLAVQEMILTALLSTELAGCRLLAEEDTPAAKRFNPASHLYLTVDPIDGTSHYAQGQPYFSTIIGLRSNTELLYTFYHFPRFGWTHRMIRNRYEVSGQLPAIELPDVARNAVIYSFGDRLIEDTDPAAQALRETGLHLIRKRDLAPNILAGSTALFLAGRVAGLYGPNPLVYDGLVGLHYAQTQGFPIYTKGPSGPLDYSQIVDCPTGCYHPGYFMALARTENS
ncbi:hypothetical protein KGQ71_00730 [Patescibacteria group bacterium]|nr:hypothetical protein [Patescibacteria group bacterium]